jgi:GTPase SAR1 family protein
MMCWRAASSSQRRHASAMQDKADSPGGKLKVVLLGEAAVGKTTLWRRWLRSTRRRLVVSKPGRLDV